MLDLRAEVAELWDPISEALQRVLHGGQFIHGPELRAFEGEVASYLGVTHAVGVNSGTDALLIGLQAAGVGRGDEVITTPFTFFATVEAIVRLEAVPVFVDIADAGFNIDPDRIADAVTRKTKAIVPVHLFGEPVRMTSVLDVAREHDLRVVEDAAQAFGAYVPMAGSYQRDAVGHSPTRTGAVGDVGAFSFYPTKNLGAYGDGGLIATSDAAIAERAVALRNHGSRPGRRYEHELPGYNSRLDEVQAAVLRVKLPHVDRWNAMRREVAARYDSMLTHIDGVRIPQRTGGHVYHQYTIRVPQEARDRVLEAFALNGISSSLFYPLWREAWPTRTGREAVACTRAEAASAEVISLPMHPRLSVDHQWQVVTAVKEGLS